MDNQDKVFELVTEKILSLEEAFAIMKRSEVEQKGFILLEKPDGTLKVIEIGEVDFRDMVFYAENLKNHTMEQYSEAVREDDEYEPSIS